MATSRMADQIGRIVGGRYRIQTPIGTGASADVFLADDVTLRRRVALKRLHAALAADDGFLRRFRAEAQAAAAMHHPNIMSVFDWGEDPDGPYLVLEHLAGGSLRDLLDTGARLTPSQALLVGLEAAKGLDHAHRRGLVHRDVKPANLLFDEEGRLRIADFGVARALAEAAWTEPSGAVLGTARYASPEQARGSSLDGRADVYSLALVLVECVTGRVPFAADTTLATLMARTTEPIVAPAELGPLKPIVEACGTIDPGERLDAAGMVRALERAANELPRPDPLPLAGPAATITQPVAHHDPTELGRVPGAAEPTVAASAAQPDSEAGLAPEAYADDRPPRAGGRRRAVLAVIAGLLAVATIAAVLVARANVPSHPVPDLVGDMRTAAEAEFGDRFDIEVTEQRYDDDTTAGEILSQNPSPEFVEEIDEGSTIEITVSRGPTPVEIPDLASMSRAEAEEALTDAGFVVGHVDEQYDDAVPAGMVANWEPKGTRPRGTTINLRVSRGPTPVEIPDVRSQSLAEAKSTLERLGFQVADVAVFSDKVESGRVVATDPAGGTSAQPGAKVTVQVSKGPELVAVPDVRGRNVGDASEIIERAGLNVSRVEGNPRRQVIGTDPEAGTRVRRGSSVVLFTR